MWWLDNRVARTKRKHYHRYHNSISKNTVDPVTEVMYEENPTPDFLNSNNFSYAIVVTGEHPYSETVGDSLNLTIPEPGPTMITNVCGAVKCVVVLISGRPVVIEPYVSFVHALGAMGFGLPAAIGAAVARPDAVVVDIDSDGSFIMNVQELATIGVENLPVKILLLNNQHLGMVVQWEDRFYKANRAHTYLGNPSKESKIFPNMLKFAEACDIPATCVTRKADLRAAIQKMLDTPGPYLLDVIVPHQEHVLPMIPAGRSFMDVITKGDGRTKY